MRAVERLTALDVRRAMACGKADRLNDGGGLCLHITGKDAASWFFRYGAGGKSYLGLGPAHTVSLADARAKAAACRKLLLEGCDPKAARDAERAVVEAAAKAEAAALVTFDMAVDAYCTAMAPGWKTTKHERGIRRSLVGQQLTRPRQTPTTVGPRYAATLAELPVGAIDTTLVLKVLQPIWKKQPDTARRLRERIEAVLDYAKVRGWRDGENPARWRGHLDQILPSAIKLHVVKPHKALPYAQLPDFMRRLRAADSVAARLLEFIVLTGARLQEARLARFDEIEEKTEVKNQVEVKYWIWKIPGGRMKKGREHSVPLSKPALELVDKQRQATNGPFLFPGARRDCVSDTVIASARNKLDPEGLTTTHGLRSTFSDWAAERTEFSDSLVEIALAHLVGNASARAYRRGDRLEKRRELMAAWGRFCSGADAVVPLRAVS